MAAFRDADCFVLTSLAENFSVAVVEAMAAGLPVVVTNTVGVAPAVAAHGAGLMVPRNEEAVAAGMVTLLKSETLRKQMGEAGKLLARTRYNPDSVAKEWLDQFGSLGRATGK